MEKALISGFLKHHAEAASAKHSKREREQIEEQQLGAKRKERLVSAIPPGLLRQAWLSPYSQSISLLSPQLVDHFLMSPLFLLCTGNQGWWRNAVQQGRMHNAGKDFRNTKVTTAHSCCLSNGSIS